MGKYTVDQIDENTGENHDKSTTDIINIALVSAIITLPGMGNDIPDNIKHITYSKIHE
jgi:hypothetical protein